ncbi:ribosome biogenesis protein ytm1 [Coemansia nantahalensis]|nr:ribosome biogenesis protein ytm1 [Coemansia nantahalensis]
MDECSALLASGSLGAAVAAGELADSELGLGAARQLSQALEQRLDACRAEIQRQLDDNREAYAAAVAEVSRAQDTADLLLHGIDDMQALVGDDETGAGARLAAARHAEAQAVQQMNDSGSVLRCLRRLAALKADLHGMDVLVREQRLDAAAEAVVALEAALAAASELEGAQVSRVLADRVSLARLSIKDRALERLGAAVAVDIDERVLRVRADRTAAEPALFEALERLGATGEALQSLGARLVSKAVRPLLAARGIRHMTSADDVDVFAVELGRTGDVSPPADVCGAVLGMVDFVDRVLGAASGHAAGATAWSGDVLSGISQLVLERCLLRLGALAPGSGLADYLDVANALVEFEETLLARCPLAERPIQAAANRVEELFVEQRSARALVQARELADATSFQVYEMSGHEVLSADTLCALAGVDQLSPALAALAGEGAAVFPQCAISGSARELVALAYRLANEALMEPARQALDVYGALFPVLHKAELKAPALAWQYYNDCMYAAHHAAHLGAACDSGERGAWQTTAQRLVDAAAAHVAEMERGTARELERIVDAGSYADSAQDGRRAALAALSERVRRAVAQLCRAAMPPAVTPHVFYSALGRHLDAVFDATAAAVIDVRDISLDDSQVLSDHCRSIHGLVDLFRLDAQVLARYAGLAATASSGAEALDPLLQPDGDECAELAARYCAQAGKLAQLADVLLISRADILARRRAGLLAQFTVDELVGLVRALFSDTHERARDIDELRRM